MPDSVEALGIQTGNSTHKIISRDIYATKAVLLTSEWWNLGKLLKSAFVYTYGKCR